MPISHQEILAVDAVGTLTQSVFCFSFCMILLFFVPIILQNVSWLLCGHPHFYLLRS